MAGELGGGGQSSGPWIVLLLLLQEQQGLIVADRILELVHTLERWKNCRFLSWPETDRARSRRRGGLSKNKEKPVIALPLLLKFSPALCAPFASSRLINGQKLAAAASSSAAMPAGQEQTEWVEAEACHHVYTVSTAVWPLSTTLKHVSPFC